MGLVLTLASDVTCGHPPIPGRVETVSSAKLTVDHSAVLTRSGVALLPISNCPLTPSQTTITCVTVTSVTAGDATKLTVFGVPVLLADLLQGESSGSVSGAAGQLGATANQMKLTAG